MKERGKLKSGVCVHCGQTSLLCECCEGCIFPFSEHCQNCDSCSCQGC